MADNSPSVQGSDQKGPDPDSRALVGMRSVDIIVSLLLLALACLLGWDSWRVGNSWASDGPQAGYFPFYLSLTMGLAALWGLGSQLLAKRGVDGTFVDHEQFGRVLMVLLPTIAFCLATQFIGIYVASFLLVLGFMWQVGRIALWACLLTSTIFTLGMFVVFEIAFNVIMPKGPLEAALGF